MFIRFYLPRLADNELQIAMRWAFHAYDHAPAFCGWLVEVLQNEQLRRLVRGQETDAVMLPANCWSNRELVGALNVAHTLSFTVREYAIGAFIDELALTLNAFVGEQLTRETKTRLEATSYAAT